MMKSLAEQHAYHQQLCDAARQAGFGVQADKFGRGTFLCSSTDSVERLMLSQLKLKPMATAPKPTKDEYFHVLVLDSWSEMGQPCTGWKMVYWLDAFDGRPEGWYHQNCMDLRNPLGWVLSTLDLATANPSLAQKENE